MDVILDDVKRFFDEVKTETVILNLTHFEDFILNKTNNIIFDKLKERYILTAEQFGRRVASFFFLPLNLSSFMQSQQRVINNFPKDGGYW